jgi:hypothetical protein
VCIYIYTVPSQPGQIDLKTLSGKNPSQQKAGGVAQGSNPSTTHTKKKNDIG